MVEEIVRTKNLKPPFILRFPQILDSRVERLHEAFGDAISKAGYTSRYHGLFPIKVNQDREIVEQIAEIGQRLDHGLEVGSKSELIAAMGTIKNKDSMIVVNGYKDTGFIDLALIARKIGIRVVIVMETPDELDLIVERATRMGVVPTLGIRLRLACRPGGRWCKTNEIFGLTSAEVISVVDQLRSGGRLGWLKMIHFHQGSQLGKLDSIRKGAREGARVYAAIYREGAKLEMLNVGGGLALNYDGSKNDPNAGKDYDLPNYASAIVETVRDVLDADDVPHPVLLSESGRAVCAHQSVFVLNIHSVSSYLPTSSKPADRSTLPAMLKSIIDEIESANRRIFLEQRSTWAEQIDALFFAGQIDLRQRATAESELRLAAVSLAHSGEEISQLEIHDIAYANFSVFQSLPDHWGIRQKFPVMPLQKLDRRPKRLTNISDLTCDCDGRLESPTADSKENAFIPIHSVSPTEDYYLGVFLTGAYQESLGGSHNLFGRTHSITIKLEGDQFVIGHCRNGQSSSDILSLFNYEPDSLAKQIITLVSEANSDGKITGEEGAAFINTFRAGLKSGSYLTSEES